MRLFVHPTSHKLRDLWIPCGVPRENVAQIDDGVALDVRHIAKDASFHLRDADALDVVPVEIRRLNRLREIHESFDIECHFAAVLCVERDFVA